jgi:hypothetical protein
LRPRTGYRVDPAHRQRHRVYRLNEAGVSALRDQLDTYWKRALSGFEQVMEEDT